MKIISMVVCAVLMVLAYAGNVNSDGWDNRTVYTDHGIVKFVPDGISPEALSQILFPASKPKTRSLFDQNPASSESVDVSIAMLIQFQFDSDVLTNSSKGKLDTIGMMLNLDISAERSLVIEGHTDVIGTSEYNLSLSVRRARSVMNYLTSEHGIESYRLGVVGKGETSLIDPNSPKSAVNRRVQFVAG